MSETEHDIRKMKVADLKRELKLRNLSTTGHKNELQDRLQTALLEGDISLEDTAISADLLGDDVLTDEEEKAILSLPAREENELLTSPVPSLEISNVSSAQTIDNMINTTSAVGVSQFLPKKVVLKRKNSFSTPISFSNTIHISKENTEPMIKILKDNQINSSIVPKTDTTDAKVIGVKVSQLTLQERLEMRAKKFGLTSCSSDLTSKSNTAGVPDVKQIEMLKKRAERFGCIVSPTIAQIDANEKLLKRKERFGNVEANKNEKNNVDLYAEKARLRLKRFETSSNSGSSKIVATATK